MKISDAIAIAFIAFCVATPAFASKSALFAAIFTAKHIPDALVDALVGLIVLILGAIAGYILGKKIDFNPWVTAVIGAILAVAFLDNIR